MQHHGHEVHREVISHEITHQTTPTKCQYCHKEFGQGELHTHILQCPEKPMPLKCGCRGITMKESENHMDNCEKYPVRCLHGCDYDIPRGKMVNHDCIEYLREVYLAMRTRSTTRTEYLHKLEQEKDTMLRSYSHIKTQYDSSNVYYEGMIEDMDKYVFHCNTSGCVIYGYYEGIGAKIGEKMIFKCAHCEYKYCVKNCLSPCSECRPEEDELELHHSTEILLCKGCCHSKCEHEGCRNPKKTFCTKKHRTLCSSCNKTLCQGCRRVCGKTGKVICPDCCRTCSTCKKTISIVICLECVSCGNKLDKYLCNDDRCAFACGECTDPICHKCFTKCKRFQVCGKVLCRKCKTPCFSCNSMLCKGDECRKYCMHENHTPDPVPICNECVFCDCPRCGIICNKCKYIGKLTLPATLKKDPINLNTPVFKFTESLLSYVEKMFKVIWHNRKIVELHFGKIYIYIYNVENVQIPIFGLYFDELLKHLYPNIVKLVIYNDSKCENIYGCHIHRALSRDGNLGRACGSLL